MCTTKSEINLANIQTASWVFKRIEIMEETVSGNCWKQQLSKCGARINVYIQASMAVINNFVFVHQYMARICCSYLMVVIKQKVMD